MTTVRSADATLRQDAVLTSSAVAARSHSEAAYRATITRLSLAVSLMAVNLTASAWGRTPLPPPIQMTGWLTPASRETASARLMVFCAPSRGGMLTLQLRVSARLPFHFAAYDGWTPRAAGRPTAHLQIDDASAVTAVSGGFVLETADGPTSFVFGTVDLRGPRLALAKALARPGITVHWTQEDIMPGGHALTAQFHPSTAQTMRWRQIGAACRRPEP